MQTYEVAITETLRRVVRIAAESEEAAVAAARRDYDAERIVLDWSDFRAADIRAASVGE